MLQDLMVLHRRGNLPLQDLPVNGFWLRWKTCLREIGFGKKAWADASAFSPDIEIYMGEEAYRFVLEIICGLHSPLAGETEILGQYRDLLEKNLTSLEDKFLRRVLESLLADAKVIRHQHLSHLGSQSYGSLARKILNGQSQVHFLGSGQLCREMLPWFSSFSEVKVFCRHPDRDRAELEKILPKVEVLDLVQSCDSAAGALIAAAPLSRIDIETWIAKHSHSFTQIIDLRADSTTDAIRADSRVVHQVIDLQEFYRDLENQQSHLQVKLSQAKIEITRLSRERIRSFEITRPFGWDDLCA
jgi:glutamyl-tRNA reductase